MAAVGQIPESSVGARRDLPLMGCHHGWLHHPEICPSSTTLWMNGSATRTATSNDRFLHPRTDGTDPNLPARLLQRGRTSSPRFSCFASTKRPFVISRTRPGAEIQLGNCPAGKLTVIGSGRLGLWPSATRRLNCSSARGCSQRGLSDATSVGALDQLWRSVR